MGQLNGRVALMNGTERRFGAAAARALQASRHPPKKCPTARGVCLAEREGFEPPLGCPKPDFESGAFDHSAISPFRELYRVIEREIVRVSPCGNPRIPRASLLSALRDRRVLRHGVLRHPRYSLGCLVEPPL